MGCTRCTGSAAGWDCWIGAAGGPAAGGVRLREREEREEREKRGESEEEEVAGVERALPSCGGHGLSASLLLSNGCVELPVPAAAQAPKPENGSRAGVMAVFRRYGRFMGRSLTPDRPAPPIGRPAMAQRVKVLAVPVLRRSWCWHAWAESAPDAAASLPDWRKAATLPEKLSLLQQTVTGKVAGVRLGGGGVPPWDVWLCGHLTSQLARPSFPRGKPQASPPSWSTRPPGPPGPQPQPHRPATPGQLGVVGSTRAPSRPPA